MKIASFNINNINRRLTNLLNWLREAQPDIVCLQELNAYLLGREYFELAAIRHLPLRQAVELRRQRSFDVFIAGMIVAGFVAVPLLNLFTPLFATAFMTRIMKRRA